MWVENININPADQNDRWAWVDDPPPMNEDDYYDGFNYADDGGDSSETGTLLFENGSTAGIEQDPFANGGVNDDANWQNVGDDWWINSITGEMQDDAGNFLGYYGDNTLAGDAMQITENADGSFYDAFGNYYAPDGTFIGDSSGLTPRGGDNPTEIIRPTDLGNKYSADNNSGNGIFGDLFKSLGALLGGGQFSASSSPSPRPTPQQQQQQLNALKDQLAAARSQGSPTATLNALRAQIAALQRNGSSSASLSLTTTLLIAAAVGGVVYLAARPKQNAA